ncbi:MAG: hypothetical protein IT424_03215 [Pirellulales bacterium]|nr:hypothetical protein [Pirellulales bacterium]
MDRPQIEAVIAALDACFPREDACVAIRRAGDSDQCTVVANQRGYQRLGVELLKAAYAPTNAGGQTDAVCVDLSYLLAGYSQLQLTGFERRDPEPRTLIGDGILAGLSNAAVALGMLSVFIVGCYTVANWVTTVVLAF